jgi:hypothetical protein
MGVCLRGFAFMSRRLFALLALAGIALAPVAVEARNRTSDMLMDDFRQRSGYGDSTISQYVASKSVNDIELLPGLFESRGGFTSRHRNQGVSLSALRLFNEGSVPICVRAKAKMVSGALANSRSAGNMGINMLIEPGRSENIMAYTANRYIGGTNEQWERGYYFWLPGPTSMEKRCSGNAPADLMQWDALPLSQSRGVRYSPELGRRLGMIPAQSGSPRSPAPSPQASSIPRERRTAHYYLIQANGSRAMSNGVAKQFNYRGMLRNSNGKFESSLAAGQFGNGTFGAADVFFNNSGQTVCLYVKGKYDIGMINARRQSGSPGPKAVPPYNGTYGVAFEVAPAPPPAGAQFNWLVQYFVWKSPRAGATDADCAATFVRDSIVQYPAPKSHGEIVVHPLLQ